MSNNLATTISDKAASSLELTYSRVLFLICPTGYYCREDRCQSFFSFELIPSMRAPMEECEAAAGLKDIGAEHLIIDAPALRLSDIEFENKIANFHPDLILMGVTFGSLESDLSWARKIKRKLPGVKIGLRGAPSYTLAKDILSNNSVIDLCIRGDYEITVAQLCRYGIKNCPGVAYRDENGCYKENLPQLAESLDTLPLPDRTTINNSLYRVRGLKAKQATVHVQRGCPFPCTYCLVHTVSGKKVRHRSPQSIAEEVKLLLEQGINYFYFRAETFTLNKQWAIEVAKELEARCPSAKWVTTTRVECVDLELLRALKKGGCYGISFGIDVTSKVISKKVKKPVVLHKAKDAIKMCNEVGIISLGYFMIGFPWETKETLKETAHFIKSAKPDLITIHYAHPYPGTSYYQEVRNLNIEISSYKAQAEPAFIPSELSATCLQSFGRKILLKHYLNPIVLYSILRKFIPLLYSSLKFRWHAK